MEMLSLSLFSSYLCFKELILGNESSYANFYIEVENFSLQPLQ